MCVVGTDPEGTPHFPSLCKRAVLAYAQVRLNWPVNDRPSHDVESSRRSRRRSATPSSVSHMTSPGRLRIRSTSFGRAKPDGPGTVLADR